MICPKCQAEMSDSARFCSNCGLSFSSFNTPTEHAEAHDLPETLADFDPLVGQTLDGKYELLALLGEGGMGAVYRARRVHIGDEVALKMLLHKFVADSGLVERFRREARAAAQLRHPNVVAIYDYGEARERDAPAYIVMELVEGESLRQLLRREGRLTPERAIALMRDTCAGVTAAHRRQIFHRDLKPDNVIVLPADEDRERETVKVVDFGLAKLRDAAGVPTLTQTGAVMGTPHYMSPEQCQGDALDARSDVYSLGAMLYEMLAGKPPFIAASLMGVLTKHITEAPPPLPEDASVPAALTAVIMRALAKDPDTRPADAAALSRELRAVEAETLRRQQEAEAQRRREAEQRRKEEEQRRREVEQRRKEEAERQHKEEEESQRLEAEERWRLAAEARHRQAQEERKRLEREAAAAERLKQETVEKERQRSLSRAPAPAVAELPAVCPTAPSAKLESMMRLVLTMPHNSAAQPNRTKLLLLTAAVVLISIVSGIALTLWRSQSSRAVAGNQSQSGQAASKAVSKPQAMSLSRTMTNSLDMEFVLVPAGKFIMGAVNGSSDEMPIHPVIIREAFYMGRYEVTQAQWQAVMKSEPSSFKGLLLPVEQVSWDDAQEFIRRLNALHDGLTYQLPSEAEWEYACRANTTGDDAGNLKAMGWVNEKYSGKTHPVGQKQPNTFGLYDMHGNVWEWCEDYYNSSYNNAPVDGTAWLSGGEATFRIVRGGSWANAPFECSSAYRFKVASNVRNSLIGLRVVASARM